MKLKHFVAMGVHGYLDFDIQFHEHLTFLIGPNGSGKSTALALMEALLTPSLRELASLEFAEATLLLEDGGPKLISATKTDRELAIHAHWVEDPLIVPLDKKRREILLNDRAAADEFFSNLTLEHSSNRSLREISEVAAPVFLGIERQHKKDLRQGDIASLMSGDLRSSQAVRSGVAARRLLRGNLAAGLFDTQLIVQEAYRTARRQVDASQEKLRSDVLLSGFKYIDLEAGPEGFTLLRGDSADFDRLEHSRAEITGALTDLGLNKDVVEQRVGAFFQKISELVRKMGRVGEVGSENVLVEFLTNRGHVERLQELIGLVQEFKKKSDRSFNRIHQFCSLVNSFFVDSGKSVSLDQIGRISIERKDGKPVALDALSSGERQLIIIFSHIFFNSFGARSKVYVIDEPELSLHMRWQEVLVESIRRVAPECQLVFATHSPDMVGDNKQRCVQV